MVGGQKVTFAVVSWDARAERDLAQIAQNHVDDWRDAVTRGAAQLLAIQLGPRRIGSTVYEVTRAGTIDVLAMRAEAVNGVNVVRAAHRWFVALARVFGVRRLRCWTSRNGLARALVARGANVAFVQDNLCIEVMA